MRSLARMLGLAGLLMSSAAHAEYWCPPGPEEEVRASGECIDASAGEVKAGQRKWYAAARKEAAQLPVDYQDLIVAFFSQTKRADHDAFCLVVFDDPPAAALARRLRALNRNPRYCPSSPPDFRYIHRFRQIGADQFLMNYSSYCGPLCAGEWEVIFTRKADGSFAIENRGLWIS